MIAKEYRTGFLKLRFQISRLRSQASCTLPLASQQWITTGGWAPARREKAVGCPPDPAGAELVRSIIVSPI